MTDRTRLPLPETPYKAGHYCNKCGQYGSPTAQHTRPNSGQLCNYLAVQAPRFTDSDMHAYAAAQSAADNADLLDHKKSAPLCDKHKPTGGARSVCLICAIRAQQVCLSKISYACEPPNEMEVSAYDWHGDEDSVVDQVKKAIARTKVLEDALWTMAEHNELYFGKNHSTVIQARAALEKTK